MAVSQAEFATIRYDAVSAFRRSMSRGDFFAGLYILGCVNGLAGGIIQSARSGDWVGGFANISVIVLFACFAGVTLLLRDNRTESIRAPDFAVAAVFLLLVALPVSPASWLAVTGLSFYILLLRHGGSARGRGAVILLAVTVPMLWSPILFHFFSEPILATDAAMVSWLLGTERVGNMVRMADGSANMVVFPDCSSLKNVSVAFLCWIGISRFVAHTPSRRDLLFCLAACGSVIAVNVVRICLMGCGQEYYHAIHNPQGDIAANTIMLVLTIGFCVLGVRRELFARP